MSRAARTEDNGRRLLEAARAVFVRRGYQLATVDDIAAAAGLTKGAVYARFAGKADLLLALLDERIDQRLDELGALPPAGTAPEAVEQVFRQWLERSQDAEWNLLILEFRVVAARDPELNRRYAALHDRVVEAVAARIAAAATVAGVRLRWPAEQVARVGLLYANGFLLERAVAGEGELPTALVVAGNGALIGSVLDTVVPAARRGQRRR